MNNLLIEISQFGFTVSLFFVIYIIFDFFAKFYGRAKLGKETKFQLTKTEKVLFWLSLSYIFTFLI